MIDNILLILFVLILSAKLAGGLFKKIGLDSTLGELLVGIIFGGSVLGWISPHSIEEFALIGSIFILFIAGMKQANAEEIYKDKKAVRLGLTLLSVTGIVMSTFFYFVPRLFGVELNLLQAIVMGLAFAIVDIGVPAKVLLSKGILNLPAGKITLRSAVVNIIAGLLAFTVLSIFVDGSASNIIFKAVGIVAFLLITVGLFYFLSRISKFVMKIHIDEAEFTLALVIVLALAYLTEIIGFSSVLGAFIAGVLIAKLPFAETRSFSDKIKSISFGLFVPLFFVWFGLEINLAEIWEYLSLAVLIFVVYAGVRFIITYLHMKKYKFKTPGLISSSMLSVDIESLVILMIALQIGIFTTSIPLTLFAPSVFFSTFFIVVLVAFFSKFETKKHKKIKWIS
jgi:Kef-type K+ transport system membrane component KefB